MIYIISRILCVWVYPSHPPFSKSTIDLQDMGIDKPYPITLAHDLFVRLQIQYSPLDWLLYPDKNPICLDIFLCLEDEEVSDRFMLFPMDD